MVERRALMTDRERELIAGGEDVNTDLRYQAISRVRRKIEERLWETVTVLEEHHPELYQELCTVVCERESSREPE